jgi:hypothetical protein
MPVTMKSRMPAAIAGGIETVDVAITTSIWLGKFVADGSVLFGRSQRDEFLPIHPSILLIKQKGTTRTPCL